MCAGESESVRVTRRIVAPPESVFKAWTDEKLLQRWLAPVAKSDPRVGGCFRLEVAKSEGNHVVTGEYRELKSNEHITATWIYQGPLAPGETVETLLIVSFRKDGSHTEIHLNHEHLTNLAYRNVIRAGAWAKALDQLETLLTVPI